MPSKAGIVKYWEKTAHIHLCCDFEVSHPACWACCYDAYKDNDGENDNYSTWNKQRYLERCHIVPKAFGGCDCEANLVLLCRKCHKASPDSRVAESFVRWLKGRQHTFGVFYKELVDAASELNFSFEDFGLDLSAYKDEFQKYLTDNALLVKGTIARTTYIACLIEFKNLIQQRDSTQR